MNKNKLRINETLDLGEDQLFQFTYFPKAKGVLFIEDKIYIYNATREDSLMSKYYSMREYKLTKHLEQTKLILENSHPDSSDNNLYTLDLIDWLVRFVACDLLSLDNECLQQSLCKKFITIVNDFHKLSNEEIAFLRSSKDYMKILEISLKDVKADVLEEINLINKEIKYIDEIENNIKSGKKYKIGRCICKILRIKDK